MFALEGAVEFHHTQGCLYMSVCVFYVHLICLCVPKSAVAGVAPHNDVYVHFICLCVCVYPSELLLESLHIQGCYYVYVCSLSVYVFVPSQLLLESLHYMCLSELLLESLHYMCLSELLLELLHALGCCWSFHAWVCVYICA